PSPHYHHTSKIFPLLSFIHHFSVLYFLLFFFNDTAPTEIYTLSLHDALPILDADLEYDPQDIPRLLAPVLDGRAEVVYGNRQFGSHSSFSFWYVMGNKAVTTYANVLFNCYLGDLETCFKLMPLSMYRELAVRSRGFGMEAEITGKLLRRGVRPYEVPISYRARTREEGKK